MNGMDWQTMLAQAPGAGAGRDPTKLLIVIGLLIVTVLVFGLVVMQLRRKLLSRDEGASVSASVLDDLRSMHRRGEISDDEYQTARRRMIQKMSPGSGDKLSRAEGREGEPMKRAGRVPRAGAASAGGVARVDLTGDPLPERASANPPELDDPADQSDQASPPR